MKIAVGPAPSHWGTETLGTFYQRLAQGPVDYVYLGETVCLQRYNLSPALLDSICSALARAGKKVYASSLMLVREESEHRAFHDIAGRIGRIEVNSPAFLRLARKYQAVGGMALNTYNSDSARILARYDVHRITLPCELDLGSIASVAKGSGVATEVVVHGHVPLGVSCTCHTMRSLGRDDDDCEAHCRAYPEGMTLEAGGRPMFRIDGPQTLSAATYCLVEYLLELARIGVNTVRILPQWRHTDRIVQIYRDVLDRRRTPRDALEELKTLSPTGLCNGWLIGKAGWIYESPN